MVLIEVGSMLARRLDGSHTTHTWAWPQANIGAPCHQFDSRIDLPHSVKRQHLDLDHAHHPTM